MGLHPRRTNVTGLSDDELIILDVMFNGGVAFNSLRRSCFTAQFNYPPHSFDDAQLRATMERFLDTDVVTTHVFEGTTYFQMTPCGGRLWETERLPQWGRYATDQYCSVRSGKSLLTIAAATPEARDDFWRIGCEVRLFAYSTGCVRKTAIKNHVLIPWKRFDAIYIVTAILDCGDSWPSTDVWREYEERRTWWRIASELDKFWESQ